jgi:hypothetical protein
VAHEGPLSYFGLAVAGFPNLFILQAPGSPSAATNFVAAPKLTWNDSAALALQERWGGKLHWHDGSHAGHLFSQRVQAVSEQFLRSVSE